MNGWAHSGIAKCVSTCEAAKALASRNLSSGGLSELMKKGDFSRLELQVMALKGTYNGFCNRGACLRKWNVTWYNHSTEAFYCEECAHRINSANRSCAKRLYGHDLCTQQLDHIEKYDVVVGGYGSDRRIWWIIDGPENGYWKGWRPGCSSFGLFESGVPGVDANGKATWAIINNDVRSIDEFLVIEGSKE